MQKCRCQQFKINQINMNINGSIIQTNESLFHGKGSYYSAVVRVIRLSRQSIQSNTAYK